MRNGAVDNKKECLFSRIGINATLTSNLAKVRERLKQYPNMKLERDGSYLLYLMQSDAVHDHFFSFEFGKESMAITTYSKSTPVRFLQETVLRLLGMMQALSECYEIKLESLYPYLIMTVAGQRLDFVTPGEGGENVVLPDIVLSKRLIALMRENINLRDERDRTAKNFKRVVLKAVVSSSVHDHSIESIAARLGIDNKDVSSALDSAESAGYRVVITGRDTFDLVRV